MPNRMLNRLFSLIAFPLLTGCASVGLVVEDAVSPPRYRRSVLYAGTRFHLKELAASRTRQRLHWSSQLEPLFAWWHVVDLPLCLGADTVLLPYTVPRTLHTHWRARPKD